MILEDRFLALNMDNQDDEVVEQPDSDHPLFTVIESIVFEQHHRPSEHPRSVGEVEPMLRQIRLSFRLIPCEVHLRIIHTIICIRNSAAVTRSSNVALLLALHALCTFASLAKDDFYIKFMLLRASAHILPRLR